jgi:rare lipoprotein A
LTAAHRTLPIPSIIKVTNLDNGKSAVLRINDRGPFAKDRILDVSKRAAQTLGFINQGTAKVRVQLLKEESLAAKKVAMQKQGSDYIYEAEEFDNTNASSNAQGGSFKNIKVSSNPEASDNYFDFGDEEEFSSFNEFENKSTNNNYDTDSSSGIKLMNAPPKNNNITLAGVPAPYYGGEDIPTASSSENIDTAAPKSLGGQSLKPVYSEDLNASSGVKEDVISVPSAPPSSSFGETSPLTASIKAGESYNQAGSFSSYDNAEKLKNKLDAYSNSIITPVLKDSKTFYRVKVPVSNEQIKEQVLEKLKSLGIKDAKAVNN